MCSRVEYAIFLSLCGQELNGQRSFDVGPEYRFLKSPAIISLMFSSIARKSMLALAGVILGFLLSFLVLHLLGWTPENSSLGARVGILVLFPLIGIIIGIIVARNTQVRYEATITAHPESQKKIDDALNTTGGRFGIRYFILGIYVFLKIIGYYYLFALGYGLSANAHLQLILETIFDVVVGLVLLGIYLKGKKKFFIVSCVFFLALAIIDGAALIFLRSSPVSISSTTDQTNEAPTVQNASIFLMNANKPVKLSMTLPAGWVMSPDENSSTIFIEQASREAEPILSIYSLSVANFADAEQKSAQQTLYAGNGMSPRAEWAPTNNVLTTFLGYPAQITTIQGVDNIKGIVFWIDNSAIFIQVAYSTFPDSASKNQEVDSIVNSLQIVSGSLY
jgi:hypothetical protein